MAKRHQTKIERAINELWLPPSFQRKPAQPPTCKRFMSPAYPCCCGSGGGGDCASCDGAATDVAVDFGTLSLTDGNCDDCVAQTGGVVVITQFSDCIWTNFGDTVCDPGGFGDSNSAWLYNASLLLGTPGTVFWRVQLQLKSPVTLQVFASHIWTSSGWNVIDNPDCFFLADEFGKVTASLLSSDWLGSCSGSIPATVELWDANA